MKPALSSDGSDVDPRSPARPALPGSAPFAAAMFLGAFLLFLVQPLVGKFLLPSYGGGAAVWTTCMLFFQAVLLAGYAYAHLGVSRLAPRTQAVVHTLLLLAAIGATWAAAHAALRGQFAAPGGTGGGQLAPVGSILLTLAAGVGLPCLVLSATSPLLNAWYVRAVSGAAPGEARGAYRLYAISNVGSLLGLVGYPFAVEPFFSRRAQAVAWAAALGIFGCLCAYCAFRAAGRGGAGAGLPPAEHSDGHLGRPSRLRRLMWFVLPACASVLLLATTNMMTQDVAAVPFLWVLPLALYLVTFILAYAGRSEGGWGYQPRVFGLLLAAAAVGVCWVLFQDSGRSIAARIAVLAAALFVACRVCHGELAALRPPARHLTGYYLTIAAGGAAGGLLVAVVAPLVLRRYAELNFGLWACCALAAVAPLARRHSAAGGAGPAGAGVPTSASSWVTGLWAMVSIVWLMVLGVLLWAAGTRFLSGATEVHRSRDFYGTVTVYDTHSEDGTPAMRVLFHGSILHGQQFLDPARRRTPSAYYGPGSGINLALGDAAGGGRRVGVVGLGAGMLAAFGRAGDEFRFYEISPQVAALARNQFSFLADSPAHNEVTLGDARVSLEREPESRRFDVLVLDAFSSDAIPVHLLTAEAFETYRRHLAPGGLLVVHISNNHVDLEPVLRRHADDAGWNAVLVSNPRPDPRQATMASDWVLMSDEPGALAKFPGGGRTVRALRADPRLPRWTDEYASLLRVMK